MDKAKQAVSNFLSNGGKHNTVVDEDTRKAATEEHVYPQQHEELTTAVDREIHQHHHQTAIQPIKSQETRETQHTARTLPVEERKFDESNDKDTKAVLDKDAAKYNDSSVTHDTNYTTSTAPAMNSEHIHHHVHQHVQPIVQKDVVQPKTVHTTVPVHEVHTAAPVHHETTMLPGKTMEEFAAGSGEGFEPRSVKKINEFEGCPTAKDKKLRNDNEATQAIHGN